MNTARRASVAGLLATVLLSGCGEKRYAITFQPMVGEQALSCTETFQGIGTTQSSLQLLDFKMYVRDVTLVRAGGEKVPLTLEQDQKWQRDDVALLDFEDDTGSCNTASPETHPSVVGSAPAHDDYEAVEFMLGLAPESNHLDAATAPAPLNVPGMWWSWKGGYKYLKLDAKTEVNAAYYLHLGATGCDGTVEAGFTCAAGNQASIRLEGFEPETNTIGLDLRELWRDVDVNNQVDLQTDFVAGCMSGATDPECPSVYRKLGLATEGNTPPAPQTVFKVQL